MKGPLVVLIYLVGFNYAQVCPPADVIFPCVCMETWEIECSRIQVPFNLKEVFDNAAAYVPDSFVFKTLTLSVLSIDEIGDDAVEHLKFSSIVIIYNPNLQYISPNAFPASTDVTRYLRLDSNNIGNEAPLDSSIFQFIQCFKRLYHVNLSENRISSIPDNAFQNLVELQFIDLKKNRISLIGSKIFPSGVQDASTVDISYNAIASEGIAEDAFDGMSEVRDFRLMCNQMESMEQRKFQTVLDQSFNVWIGENFCETPKFHCDERADWICDNEARYRGMLFGFQCKDGSGFSNIWNYCAERRNEPNRLL